MIVLRPLATLTLMKDRQDPCAVDLTALCRQAATLQGEWPQAGMARLAASLATSGPQAAPISWSATG